MEPILLLFSFWYNIAYNMEIVYPSEMATKILDLEYKFTIGYLSPVITNESIPYALLEVYDNQLMKSPKAFPVEIFDTYSNCEVKNGNMK